MNRRWLLIFPVAVLLLAGCKKKEDGPVVSPFKASAKISFQHVFGTSPLVLSNQWYVNAANDSVRISMLKYYISNITLKSGGQSFVVPESYFLIDEAEPASKTILLSGLPPVSFDEIEFLIGVDSAKNASGAHTGALDVIHNMYWGWASGYICSKLEGYFIDSVESGFSFHVGGFNYPNNASRKVSISFNGEKLPAAELNPPTLVLKTDVSEYFKNPVTLDLKQYNSVHSPSATGNMLADNYTDMFGFVAVQ